VETNLFFDLTGALDAPTVVDRLLARGIRVGAMSARSIRAVTHLDVSAAQVEQTLEAARAVLGGRR
jgi:threonine aldolase